MKGVVYEGVRLMPGSDAFALYESKSWEALQKHMKELDHVWRRLEGKTSNEAVEAMRREILNGDWPAKS